MRSGEGRGRLFPPSKEGEKEHITATV